MIHTIIVFFIHNNACPHAADMIQDLLEQFWWDVLGHPPNFPNLAPSNFHLFQQVKQHLGGRRFKNGDDLKK